MFAHICEVHLRLKNLGDVPTSKAVLITELQTRVELVNVSLYLKLLNQIDISKCTELGYFFLKRKMKVSGESRTENKMHDSRQRCSWR